MVPPYERSLGEEAVEVAALAGLHLDPWQRDAVRDVCAVGPAGRWSTLENCVVVGRQNGKGAIIEAITLASLFVWDDALIMYSAHRFDTAQQMFKRIRDLIDGCGVLSRRVRRIYEGNGKERIELRSGGELKFLTRSDSAARGFAGSRAIIDEAFKLDASIMGAILPTMAAHPNPWIGYFSSAGWEISEQLGQLRRRALAALLRGLSDDGLSVVEAAGRLGLHPDDAARLSGRAASRWDPSLSFLEWSAPDTTPRVKGRLADPALWAMANPGLGVRLSEEFTAAELRSMSVVEFARERLGIGDYPPDPDEGGWGVIGEADWVRLRHPGDPRPGPGERPAISLDVRPDRRAGAVAVAYRDGGGHLVVEVVAHAAGTGWIGPRVVDVARRHEACAVAVDTVGPASGLIGELDRSGIGIVKLSGGDVADAYARFHEAAVDTRTLRHLDQQPLNDAVRDAATRPLGDRTTWDRRGDGDISPLVAATNAVHALLRSAGADYPIEESVY